MHGKIIQLENEPVPEDRFVTVFDAPDWFTSGVADYVDKVDAEDVVDIVTLLFDRDGIHFDARDRTVTFSDTEYFEKKFVRFAEKLAEIQDKLTLDWFSHSMGYEMAEIRALYNDRYGNYICHSGKWYTLDDFVRYCADRDTVYYVGGMLDYHC